MRHKETSARKRRARRVRRRIRGTKDKPRLSVFRSSKYLYAQLIDDQKERTIVSVSEKDLEGLFATTRKTEARKKKVKEKQEKNQSKIQRASAIGEILAQKARAKKIAKVAFDRGPYKYHGRVKAFADAARKHGLKF